MNLNRVIAIWAAVALSATLATAQGGNWGSRNYNPATEATIKGTVQEVQLHPGKGMGTGTHLVMKTDSGNIDVHAGPTSYLQGQQVSFAKGDEIEVTGSKVGADTLIAREIKKGDKVLTLRDKQGVPRWAGNRQAIK